MKWKGERKAGLAFYDLLRSDVEFCAELGRAVMAAGRLESALIRYLRREPNLKTQRATLGMLTRFAESRALLTDLVPVLKMLSTQRNYLAHSLHALFSGLVEETILPRTDLLDSDVVTFTERAWQLHENLDGLAEILEERMHVLSNEPLQPPSGPKIQVT